MKYRPIAIILLLCMSVGMISGCSNSSINEYLQDLGMIDPMDYDESVASTSIVESAGLEDAAAVASSMADTGNTSFVMEEIPREIEGPDPAVIGSDASDVSSSGVSENRGSSEGTSDHAAASDSGDKVAAFNNDTNVNPADTSYSSAYTTEVEGTIDEEGRIAREQLGLTESGIEALKKTQEGRYAFERLTDSGKTLYVEILTIIENLAEEVFVSTTSEDAVELVYDYVMYDHPEIFYVDGYQYTNYTTDNVITKIAFSGIYIYDADEIARRQTRINEAVNRCVAGAPSTDDDYEIIKYVYDYIIANTDYDISAEDNQNICSVFLNGKSVCNGYAKACQYLLNKLGIPATMVIGTVNTKNNSGVRHAWNLVQCNSAYYYLDVTWGDASYQSASGETADVSKLPEVNYDYLNVTTNEIMKNHEISGEIYMPVCNSMTDNYYVREGEYFTTADLSLVENLFNRRYSEGANRVTIKCATSDVYQSLFDQLITNRGVFDYLQGDTLQVSYTAFQESGTIIFWL